MNARKSQCSCHPTEKIMAARPSLKTQRSRPPKSKAQAAKGKGKKRAVSSELESTDNEDGKCTKQVSKTSHRQSKHARLNEADAEEVKVISSDDPEEVALGMGANDNSGDVRISDVLTGPEMLTLVWTGSRWSKWSWLRAIWSWTAHRAAKQETQSGRYTHYFLGQMCGEVHTYGYNNWGGQSWDSERKMV